MAKPTEKADGIEKFIDSLAPNPLGRRGSIMNDVCAICKKQVGEFKDNLSKKEYTISGMCQSCQDSIF